MNQSGYSEQEAEGITNRVSSENGKSATAEKDSSRGSTSTNRRPALKITPDTVYAEMSDEERYIIASSLGRCLEHSLRSGHPVYLEGLGVIFPSTSTSTRSYAVDGTLAVRKEKITTIDFEKCAELLSLHRERFESVVETRELASRLYPTLPLPIQLRWSPEKLKRCVQGLIRAIRAEVVTNGFSRKLDKVGTFYALHNRHGTTPDDWFAGADIFVSSPLRWVREVENAALFDRPILQNSSELFAAAYGETVGSLTVDVQKELELIPSFAPPQLPKPLQKLRVNVFRVPGAKPGSEASLLYCTDGMRALAMGPDELRAPRCELTLLLANAGHITTNEQIPTWPRRAFALAASIVAHQLNGRDSSWVGMSVPLAEKEPTRLAAVLLQRLNLVAHEQLSPEGEFSYVNIIGITQDELELAEELGLTNLLNLLKRKALDQVTKLQRTSVIARTAVNSGGAQPRKFSRQPGPSSLGAVQ